MDTEGPTLANDTIHQHGGLLGCFVVFDEEFLEFVDHDQDTRQLHLRMLAFEARKILHTPLSKSLTPCAEDSVDILEGTQSKFATAFDADDVGMRQLQFGIDLEFNSFFEV